MKKENKILEAAIAIPSGMLTELIYSEISTSYYEKHIVNGIETFVEVNKFNIIAKITIILFLFFAIWFLLSIIIPRLIYKFRSITRKRKPTYNTKEIIETFNETKHTVQNISFVINNGFSKISFAMLYSDDITNCINKLHTVFCSNNVIQKKTANSVFRDSLSINTKGYFISKYEFTTLVSILEKLFYECMEEQSSDLSSCSSAETSVEKSHLKNDTEELQDKIKDLKLI